MMLQTYSCKGWMSLTAPKAYVHDLRSLSRGCVRRSCLPSSGPICSIKARWCIDIRYGVKLEAVSLLQEWVAGIGSQAGLNASNTQILSGAIGAPESRLELEVEFDSLSQLEQFWASIPPQGHKAWSQRAQNLIIDGSPRWEVYRTCPAFLGGTAPLVTAAPVASGRRPIQASSTPASPSFTSEALESAGELNENGIAVVRGEDDARTVLDWKGDPMIINPGDKMPFNFQ